MNGQLQVFHGTLCCLRLNHLCLSISKRPLGKDAGVCINIPCSSSRSFCSQAEPVSTTSFIACIQHGKNRLLTLCMHWRDVDFMEILSESINLLWAVAFLVSPAFSHLLYLVSAKLLPFQNNMPKISSDRGFITEKWGLLNWAEL